MTWLHGLPCWLLGCWLAENLHETQVVSSSRVWLWRGWVLGLSIALRIAKFHVASLFASNAITLNLFAFVVCAWLRVEIAHHRKHPPSSLLEWSGQWSYSLYLTHAVAPILGRLLLPLPPMSTFMGWSCSMLFCFAVAYAFFLLVESPAQKLAKILSGRLIRRQAVSH